MYVRRKGFNNVAVLQRGRQLAPTNMLAAESSPSEQNKDIRPTEKQHQRTPYQMSPTQVAKQQYLGHSLQRSSWGAVPAKPRRWSVAACVSNTVLRHTTSMTFARMAQAASLSIRIPRDQHSWQRSKASCFTLSHWFYPSHYLSL